MMDGMIRVGITGGTGSGKSTLTAFLKEEGYTVIDADEISRDAFNDDRVREYLMDTFGDRVTTMDAEARFLIDRKKVAAEVFTDRKALKEYNSVIMPIITERIEKEFSIAQSRGERMTFLDAPMLFENKDYIGTDVDILVDADEEVRIRRVMERDSITEDMVRQRMRNQMEREEKLKRAHIVIENSGTLEDLKDKALRLPTMVLEIYGKKHR